MLPVAYTTDLEVYNPGDVAEEVPIVGHRLALKLSVDTNQIIIHSMAQGFGEQRAWASKSPAEVDHDARIENARFG